MSFPWREALPALVLIALVAVSPACSDVAPLCHTLVWLIVPVLVLTFRASHLATLGLIALFALQAQWGIAQFVFQQDVGFQLLGESVLAPDIPAVAKFSVGETKLIRAYGPYPHANVFGGVMVIAVALTMLLKRPVLLKWLLPVLFVALVLSFSRSAYLGGLVLLLVLAWQHIRALRPILIILIALSPLILFRMFDSQDQGIAERLRGYTWAAAIISEQSIASGVGLGRYEETLENVLVTQEVPHNVWEIAPVHSAPLLLIAEFGFVSAAALIGLALVFRSPGTTLALVAITPAFIFDHYLLTNIVAFTLLAFLFFSLELIPKRS